MNRFEEEWANFLTATDCLNKTGNPWTEMEKALAKLFWTMGETNGLKRAINVTQEVMLSKTEGRLNG